MPRVLGSVLLLLQTENSAYLRISREVLLAASRPFRYLTDWHWADSTFASTKRRDCNP